MTKNLAWAAAIVSLFGASACTVTSTSPDDAGATDDSDGAVATTYEASAAETSTPEEAASSEAGDNTCSTLVQTGLPACDTCLAQQCCTELTSCANATDTITDDAGNSGCIALLACIGDYLDSTPDAGEPDALDACNASHSSTASATVTTLWACRDTKCVNDCSQ